MWPLTSLPNFDLNHEHLGFSRSNFYPRPVLACGYCRCLRLCVSVSVPAWQSLACPCDNLGPDKFGLKVQNTLAKVPIVFGGQSTVIFKVKFDFKIKFDPILSFKFFNAIIHYPFKLRSPNLDQRCKTTWLRSLLFLTGGMIRRPFHGPDCFAVSTLCMYTDPGSRG